MSPFLRVDIGGFYATINLMFNDVLKIHHISLKEVMIVEKGDSAIKDRRLQPYI